jgi:hypothetical protein
MADVVDYAAVLRGRTVIASFGDLLGGSERDIFRLLPHSAFDVEQKISGGQLFSFLSAHGLSYVAVSSRPSDSQDPLDFLDALSRQWGAQYGEESRAAIGHLFDDALARTCIQLLAEYARPSRPRRVELSLLRDTVGQPVEYETQSQRIEDASSDFGAVEVGENRYSSAVSWGIWLLVVLLVIWGMLIQFCGGYRLPYCQEKGWKIPF